MSTKVTRKRIVEIKINCSQCKNIGHYMADDIGQTTPQLIAMIEASTEWESIDLQTWLCGPCVKTSCDSAQMPQQLTLQL